MPQHVIFAFRFQNELARVFFWGQNELAQFSSEGGFELALFFFWADFGFLLGPFRASSLSWLYWPGPRAKAGAAVAPLHFAGPALDGAAGALLHAAVARALLLDPVAPALLRARAPVLRLRTRQAAQGPRRGAAQGAANRLDTKAAAEGGEDQGSRRGRGCGAASPRNVRKS